MEHNRALAAEAASLLADAWRAPLGGPESMRGAMASLGLPVEHPATIETARAIRRRLWDHHRIEVPIFPFGGRLWLRISAQIYNAIEDYQRLARALAA
jgi:isopenicillin-N epimerase